MNERPELVMIAHRIPVELLAALDVLAEQLDRPRSRLMNEAYQDLIAKYDKRRLALSVPIPAESEAA